MYISHPFFSLTILPGWRNSDNGYQEVLMRRIRVYRSHTGKCKGKLNNFCLYFPSPFIFTVLYDERLIMIDAKQCWCGVLVSTVVIRGRTERCIIFTSHTFSFLIPFYNAKRIPKSNAKMYSCLKGPYRKETGEYIGCSSFFYLFLFIHPSPIPEPGKKGEEQLMMNTRKCW